ncbi:type II and III secretion system protein [Leptothrix cholodnii SP-6]|uniref:Type II and III secretion system protein n=1 Tax=Leptothrix cholodnii (strain ATCC 51168 / LMG 8142 / SP-6) TaxID=395495 RepID=B1Y7J0_LEPCP|nr:secretin and TonB N-terminal domain-containing protein [Leptothrix cholodnii]ACB36138.1 type II and III secretion system protein [Leptothrix cholodnii SP-6]
MTRTLPRIWLALAMLCGAGCSTPQPPDFQAQLEQGQHKEALVRYEEAMNARPGDPERRLQYFRARDQVINRLLALGSAEFGAGQLEPAARAWGEALGIDPKNTRAANGLATIEAARRHQLLAGDARARLAAGDSAGADLMVKAILTENPGHPAARELDRALREQERRKSLAVPVLKSRLQKPVTLEFRDAPLKLVLEALARSAGINFIMDREVRPDLKASIFVRDVRVEDALDLLIHNHQLEKKILTDNTVLVYPNTPQKLREHQELVMRTFHIGNADPKQTLNLLRTMLKVRDVFIDERVNLLFLRDTPDVIRAAERLIAAQDKADPEVVLELEILEVSRTKVRDLGITYPSEFAGPGSSGAKLFEIGELNRRTIGVDTGYKLKLLRTDGDTKTLANPRVRVRNREKARVHVGDRVPVISSTIVGTTNLGSNNTPVTTEQIQYLDVGIKIEAEPTIYADDSVAISINLDVSSLGNQTRTNAGTTAYEVGTRNASTVLRLRDGETQALMGLIRDDDVQTGAGLPYLGEFPVLDRIFGSKRTDRRSRELVLLITPQLVRGIEPADATLAEFWSGTEAAVRTRSPFIEPMTPVALGPATATATATASTAPTLTLGEVAPAAVPLPLNLSWLAPAAIRAGEPFVVALQARSDGPVKGASVQLRYDAAQLEVLAVEDGGYFDPVGGRAVFTPRIDPTLGVVFATVGASGTGSATGDGPLIRLRMKTRGPAATTRLQIGNLVAVDPMNRRLPIEGSAPLELTSRP